MRSTCAAMARSPLANVLRDGLRVLPPIVTLPPLSGRRKDAGALDQARDAVSHRECFDLIMSHVPGWLSLKSDHAQIADDAVLVQNIYLTEEMLKRPVPGWQQWEVVTKRGSMADDYARLLFTLSSPLPESYRQNINYYGYHRESGAAMLFSGTQRAMIRLSFPVAAASELKSGN